MALEFCERGFIFRDYRPTKALRTSTIRQSWASFYGLAKHDLLLWPSFLLPKQLSQRPPEQAFETSRKIRRDVDLFQRTPKMQRWTMVVVGSEWSATREFQRLDQVKYLFPGERIGIKWVRRCSFWDRRITSNWSALSDWLHSYLISMELVDSMLNNQPYGYTRCSSGAKNNLTWRWF